jgi:hypothetical protein
MAVMEEMGRGGDGERGRWGEWGDGENGEMGRWGDGEIFSIELQLGFI